jgi:hypothetical protein
VVREFVSSMPHGHTEFADKFCQQLQGVFNVFCVVYMKTSVFMVMVVMTHP